MMSSVYLCLYHERGHRRLRRVLQSTLIYEDILCIEQETILVADLRTHVSQPQGSVARACQCHAFG